MRAKRILGIIAVICGIVLFAFSDYITKQVAIGRGEIYRGQQKVNSAQGKVDTANKVVDNTTQVKGLGGLLTAPVQGQINEGQAKINAGTRKANYYDRLASNLKIGGAVLVIAGALLLLFSKKVGKWFGRHN